MLACSRMIFSITFCWLYLYSQLHVCSSFTGAPTPFHIFFELDCLDLLRSGAHVLWNELSPMMFYLFSGFPSGLQLDWTTLLLFLVTTSLVFRLIEGGWWTFFVWSKGLLGLFIHHVVSTERHQPFPRDIRFLLNISLNVTLTG